MRRIVVFDTGWGGELVADFLMREMGVVEIVRVIDWAHKSSFADGTPDLDGMIDCLGAYIGTVDLIVLGGYMVGTALEDLRRAFPEQKFVAPSLNPDKMLRVRRYPEIVAVLMSEALRETAIFRELREKLPYSTLILPECADWERLIDENLMTREIVRTELAWDFKICADSGTRGVRKAETAIGTKPAMAGLASGFGGARSTLAAASAERRALLGAIEKFSVAAERANLEERRVTTEAARAQAEYLACDPGRARVRPDLVVLLNTHFWAIKAEVEQALGWQVRVLDFREKLLHDVCAALRLRGVDGKRAK